MTIEEQFFNIETRLILNTLTHLSKGNYASATWGADRLKELGILQDTNIKILESELKKVYPEITKEFQATRIKTANETAALLPKDRISNAVPVNASERLKNILSVYDNKAIGDISKTGSTMIAGLNSVYESTVQEIISEGLVTGDSIRSTIGKTAKALNNQGVTCLVDTAGRKWSLEGYSQMVVRTNNRQVATQTQIERFDEYDIDLVEISSHVGARPLCAPYQGKVFSRSGSNPNYPALSSTSYGEPAGLFGINCGHRMYPYIEGTKKTYTPYPATENKEVYKESQKQRQIEREIRKSKRLIEEAKTLKDSELERVAKDQLAGNRKQMRSFIDETGRTRRSDRERIY